MMMVAGFAGSQKAAAEGDPAGGTVLTPGSTITISPATPAATFPLKIMADGTYTIVGNYSGNYGLPSGYSATQISTAQSAERKTPWTNAGNNHIEIATHGIYVASGLKNVTVILRDVCIITNTANGAAFFINGMQTAALNTTAATFQGHAQGSNVVVQLKGTNMLYSGRIPGNNRAGLEVWKGSTVYIEGDGSLLAKSSTTRNYSATTTYPRAATHAHPQGSPYWDTTGDNSTHEDTRSSLAANGNRSGAAGIGAGDVAGSGGNVVIREEPTVIAISGAHGAGIGGAWGTAGGYHADVLISGGTVESWGGQHGAGIGGGCAGGDGTIVVLPTASVYAASYEPARAMLGQMTNVIYFGNPDDSRLALYTEDYREVDMFLDLSKNEAVRKVIERLGGGMNPSYLPLGKTRNDWPTTATNQHRPNYPDWAEATLPAIEQGIDKYVLLLNGGFAPQNANIAFLTAAKTEKNHSYNPVTTTSNTQTYMYSGTTTGGVNTYGLNYPSDIYNVNSPEALHYAPATAALRAVPRFVMVAPTYKPSVKLTPTAPPELLVGYAVADPPNEITLTIGNDGNQRLYNPKITIIGDDYELYGGSSGTLQAAVNTALAGLITSDASGDYIAPGATFTIDLRLKADKSPGTTYNGWVLFSADNLPDAATPDQFNIHVLDMFLPPPDLVMESPTDTVVSGTYQIRAQFKDQQGLSPHAVAGLLPDDIFVVNGTVASVMPDPATEGPAGYYTDWIITVDPDAGVPNKTTISIAVKPNTVADIAGAENRTISKPKLVTYSSEGPYASFSVAEGAVLPSLDAILIYINGNGITLNKEDSAYFDDKQFTAGVITDMQTGSPGSFTLTQLPSTTLNLTPGDYELTVTDENNLKTNTPTTLGFPNGDYELTIPGGYVRNYDGNFLPATTLHFSIQMPEVPDNGVDIVPTTLPASGGTARITIAGLNLLAAKGILTVEFLDAIPGYTVGQRVTVPSANFTDTEAYLDVVLPPNLSPAAQPYRFTVRLENRYPTEIIPPNTLTTTVALISAVIDTTQFVQGYREGLLAWPHTLTFEGGAIDLKVAGENLFLLNTAPNSDLHIRVTRNGVPLPVRIPVPTTATQGGVVIPLGNAFTAEQNLSPDSVVYVFTLWYYDGSISDYDLVPSYQGIPVADSTRVKSGLDELKDALAAMHHIVSQRVANTAPDVRAWLVPRLNVVDILHKYGLTVTEDDIIFTDFTPAVEGTMAIPQGSDGSFFFTLKLHTVPEVEILLNTGEIIATGMPPVSIEREVIIPEVPGYATDPPVGDHHVESGFDFTFYLVPTSDETRMITPRVTTNRRIGSDADGVIVEPQEDGLYYLVTIRRVQEYIEIYINEKSPDANGGPEGTNAWGESGRLYVRSAEQANAVIYNTPGRRAAAVSLRAGETAVVPLPAGVYIVALNGVTYKAIVK
jgi:hypothetical protein